VTDVNTSRCGEIKIVDLDCNHVTHQASGLSAQPVLLWHDSGIDLMNCRGDVTS
jgi:hypothetical protein